MDIKPKVGKVDVLTGNYPIAEKPGGKSGEGRVSGGRE
jgi:hypothetical protein